MMSSHWLNKTPFFLLLGSLCLMAGCLNAATQKEPAGAALPDSSTPQRGYHSRIEKSADHEKWVQLDLGAVHQIDEVILVPADPEAFEEPSDIGFPPRFIVEISTTREFDNSEMIAELTAGDFLVPDGESFRIVVNRQPARYVRVTAKKLSGDNDRYFFALGELKVISRGKNIARQARVTALDSLETEQWSKHFLNNDHKIEGTYGSSARSKTKDYSRR